MAEGWAQGAAQGATAGSAFGPWGTVIGGVVGAVGGAYSAKKSGDAQKHAMEEQQRALAEDKQFRQEVYGRELAFQAPIKEELRKEYLSGQPLDYASNKAAIDREMGNVSRRITGLNYGTGMINSGIAANAPLAIGLTGAQAKAQAWAEGQKARRNMGLNLVGMANPLAAAGGVSSANQALSGMYGGWADRYGQAAQQGWQNAAQGVYGLANWWGKYLEDKKARESSMDNIPSQQQEAPQKTVTSWDINDNGLGGLMYPKGA